MNVVPVICFGYQCHVSVIPIYSCMKHRNIKHFTIASSSAVFVCCLAYTGRVVKGINFFLTGRHNSWLREIVIFNLSPSSTLVSGAATFGYLTFGGNVEDDILLNYSANKPTVLIALIAMAAKTYTTYPIISHERSGSLVFLVYDKILFEMYSYKYSDEQKSLEVCVFNIAKRTFL